MARGRASTGRAPAARSAVRTTAAPPALAAGPWAEGFALGLLLVAVWFLHGAGIRRPFFADDYLFLEQVRGRGLFAALASPDPIGNFLRPVSRALYFWTIGHTFGERPAAFHLVNLGLFLGALAVFYALIRRLLGKRPAFLALAFVSLHYAADVPLRWASGSQDLLAALFGTLTVYLQVRGRRGLAAVALVVALLSKEVAAGAALVAIVASHDAERGWRETLRRAWMLLAVTLVWALALGVSFASRPAAAMSLTMLPGHFLAALVHLVQVAVGLEWRLGGQRFGHWAPLALVPAILAGAGFVAMTGVPRPAAPPRTQEAATRRRALGIGLAWVAAGTLPLVPVMPIWSAYFYLWALFGAGVLIAVLARRLRPVLAFAVVGALVFLSANTRRLDEFAIRDDAWAWQSHVDRRYVDRALDMIEGYLTSIRAARPVLPHRSTVFFSNVYGASSWQSADGPLIRWAYQDSTLRSYFLGQFTRERAARGPIFFFVGKEGRLIDQSDEPELLFSFGLTMLITNKDRQAADAFEVAIPVPADALRFHYCRAWARWAVGDTVRAKADLVETEVALVRTPPANASARVFAAGADLPSRIHALRVLRDEAALSPWVHAHLSSLLYENQEWDESIIEAYAYRVLAPDDPAAWRNWAMAQLSKKQNEASIPTLTKYLSMLAAEGRKDPEAEEALKQANRVVHGDLAARALR